MRVGPSSFCQRSSVSACWSSQILRYEPARCLCHTPVAEPHELVGYGHEHEPNHEVVRRCEIVCLCAMHGAPRMPFPAGRECCGGEQRGCDASGVQGRERPQCVVREEVEGQRSKQLSRSQLRLLGAKAATRRPKRVVGVPLLQSRHRSHIFA